MDVRQLAKKLNAYAIKGGASSTKLISVDDIFVEDWVRQKCEYGCKSYAINFTCPPFTPTPEETKKRLQDYEHGLLVEFKVKKRSKKLIKKTGKLLFELEMMAFVEDFYKAFSYACGPCKICDSCIAKKIKSPSKFNKKECPYPKEVRPSLEACGIDVFKTVRKAGYEIYVLKGKEEDWRNFEAFGLVLLE